MGRKRKEITVKDSFKLIFLKVPVELYEMIEKDGKPENVVLQLVMAKYDK